MLEQVELKIQELKKLQTEEYYKKKDADLQAWGLTEKKENGKVTPIIVTDDEYEALIKASNGVNTVGSRNTVAKVLNVIALMTIAIGFIAGFALMTLSDSSLGFVYFSISLIAALLLAAIFMGLSEAIKLLQQLIDRKTPEKPDEAPVAQQQPQPQPQYQGYVQAQPQPQYQVTYTTATPPQYVQVSPQQFQQFVQPQPVQYQQPMQYQQPAQPKQQ